VKRDLTVDLISEETPKEGSRSWLSLLLAAGLVLVLVGVLVVFVAALSGSSNSSSVGVVIFIGPIPIFFGAGPDIGLLFLVGALLLAVSITIFLVRRKRMRAELA